MSTKAFAGEAPAALILTRRDIEALMAPSDYLEAVGAGFAAAADGHAHSPSPMAIEGAGGTFHAKGGALRLDRLYVALKLNGNFPANPDRLGLPTIQGAILLCDGETGSLLAVMDSVEVTLRRTAAATALAARFLARPTSTTILICGCGAQAAAQLEALRQVLPLTRGFAWDRDRARAEALAAQGRSAGIDLAPVAEARAAAAASDVIVTCTTSHVPFLGPDMVGPGTFVAAVGCDSPQKSELEPALLAKAVVVADVIDQCAVMGDLHHALVAGAMRREDVRAELADLVSGAARGRTNADEITVFDSTGTALQDAAAAAFIYRRTLAGPARLAVAFNS